MVLAARHVLVVVGLVLADQLTKWLALALKPSNFLFQFTLNTGAGFGMLQERNTLLVVVSVAVLLLLYKPIQLAKGRELWAYLLLVAGIVGNLIDRLVHGGVVDFISIGNFPIFNIADMLITVSVLYLVATALRDSFRSWNFGRAERR
jgi:signal peptidase II